MKKIIYTLLAVSIIFAACKKEDEEPTNSGNNTTTSIVGVWTPTFVVMDSSLTTTIDGEIVYELNGEVMTYSGSETMTAEEADMQGDVEFTSDGNFIIDNDTSSYTYSNNVLTISEAGEEPMTFACTFTATNLTITIEASIDTAWNEPGMGDITITAYSGQTIHCTRNTVINTNVSQRVGETNHSWFVKPKFDNILKNIK